MSLRTTCCEASGHIAQILDSSLLIQNAEERRAIGNLLNSILVPVAMKLTALAKIVDVYHAEHEQYRGTLVPLFDAEQDEIRRLLADSQDLIAYVPVLRLSEHAQGSNALKKPPSGNVSPDCHLRGYEEKGRTTISDAIIILLQDKSLGTAGQHRSV